MSEKLSDLKTFKNRTRTRTHLKTTQHLRIVLKTSQTFEWKRLLSIITKNKAQISKLKFQITHHKIQITNLKIPSEQL